MDDLILNSELYTYIQLFTQTQFTEQATRSASDNSCHTTDSICVANWQNLKESHQHKLLELNFHHLTLFATQKNQPNKARNVVSTAIFKQAYKMLCKKSTLNPSNPSLKILGPTFMCQ